MSRTPEELLKLASDFDNVATRALVVTAKKKEKKKLDPKAKVRNRGTACVPAESAKDKKDHFPINDEAQARNALARVHQYSAAPPWYSGSLKGLQDLVSRKVHSKYPGIGKSDKKSSEYYDDLLSKFGQPVRQPISFQRGEGQIELPDEQGNFTFPSQGNTAKPSLPVRPEVREVQEYLIKLYPAWADRLNAAGGPDGKFGPVTQSIVKEYTQNNDAEQALKLCLQQVHTPAV